jgi:hypothetical protein
MHVQYVVLCDQVILSTDGKPSLIGIVNDVQTASVPVNIPRLSFAARILFTADETDKSHHVEVVITDPAGSVIGRPGGDVSLPPAPAGVESVAVDLPMQFDMLELTAIGRYTFLLHVNQKPAGAAQLNVRKVVAS